MKQSRPPWPPPRRSMTLYTTCVNGHGPSITEMCDASRDVSRRTFLRYASPESLDSLSREMGYASHPRQGLTMAGDYHVAYSKSRYRGRPCVYLTWSGIEYVFCEPQEAHG